MNIGKKVFGERLKGHVCEQHLQTDGGCMFEGYYNAEKDWANITIGTFPGSGSIVLIGADMDRMKELLIALCADRDAARVNPEIRV